MVAKRGIIAAEIAERYGRALRTIQDRWTKHPSWPEPLGRRGRALEYDAELVDAVVRAHFIREPITPSGRPDDLLTIAQIVEYTGLKRGTIDGDISRGRIPSPDDTEHGVKRWRRATIDQAISGRRGYHRRAASPSD